MTIHLICIFSGLFFIPLYPLTPPVWVYEDTYVYIGSNTATRAAGTDQCKDRLNAQTAKR